MNNFFKKMNAEHKEKILNAHIDTLVTVLQAIDNHIEYELELANNVGLKQDILDTYEPVKYIVELDNNILKKINSSEPLCYGFYQKAVFLDLGEFKHVSEKIYSELLYRMFEMSAKNKHTDVNTFVRELYSHCNKNEFAYAGADMLARLKKYLQLAEPYIIKAKQAEETKTDFFTETKEDAYGAKLITDLLFKYNIPDEKALNKTYRRIGFFHFLFVVIIPLIITVIAFCCIPCFPDIEELLLYLGIFLLCLTIISLILFIHRISRMKHLKAAIAKIVVASKIGEDYIYTALKNRYGKKLKKLL